MECQTTLFTLSILANLKRSIVVMITLFYLEIIFSAKIKFEIIYEVCLK